MATSTTTSMNRSSPSGSSPTPQARRMSPDGSRPRTNGPDALRASTKRSAKSADVSVLSKVTQTTVAHEKDCAKEHADAPDGRLRRDRLPERPPVVPRRQRHHLLLDRQ